jgi:hypothetical protein
MLREQGIGSQEPMTGWPAGFFRVGADERMCFVVLNELPERKDTLLLRLQGHGAGLPRALVELDALPATSCALASGP